MMLTFCQTSMTETGTFFRRNTPCVWDVEKNRSAYSLTEKALISDEMSTGSIGCSLKWEKRMGKRSA